MIIVIGTTSDDRRVLTKSFSGAEVTVQLKAPCDILNPIFILDYDATRLTCNYLYCEELHRYYFINHITVTTGHRIELSCSVDVLMSYNSAIKGLTCNIARNESIRTAYISDSNKPLTTKTQTQTYVFDKTPFVTTDMYTNYVLTVVGGVSSGS